MDKLSIVTNSFESKVVGNNKVQGMAKMRDYYKDVLYPFVNKLIRDNVRYYDFGCQLDIDELSTDDLYQFATHLIQYDDRTLYCISENNDNDDIVSALFKLLKKDDLDEKISFADLVKDKVISYYKDRMQELINDVLPWVEKEYCSDNGLVRYQHRDNGETFWVYR